MYKKAFILTSREKFLWDSNSTDSGILLAGLNTTKKACLFL